jgi:IclR family acetate operon transcriptional repressor
MMKAMRSIQRNDEATDSVVGRAMTILTAFGPADTVVGLAELTRRTRLPKATVHRLLGELTAWAAVERTEGGYRLGMRLFELGQLAPRQRGLREAALPLLSDLYEATHETVHLGVLDGLQVVYVEKLAGRGGPALASRVGGRMPAHCTGLGKAMLAFSPPSVLHDVVAAGLTRLTTRTIVMPGILERELTTVRTRGVAFEHEESTPGVVCAACPVLGPDGTALAAISVAGWADRLDTARLAPAVRTAALGLSRQLGGGPSAQVSRTR